MGRNWHAERDWWLHHFFQLPGGQRQTSQVSLAQGDYLAIPIACQTPTPLVQPCLIWRWSLDDHGYGRLRRNLAHRVAYEQSRATAVLPDKMVLHLCHRPFCVQPAHLYVGTAKDNAEDRAAIFSEMHSYKTWEQLGDRFDKAMSSFYWPPPPAESIALSYVEAPDCLHSFVRPAGDVKLCANCGETELGHRRKCKLPRLCRCIVEPCVCQLCLESLLSKACARDRRRQNLMLSAIPKFVNDSELPKDEAKFVRAYLESVLRSYGRVGAT